MTVYSQENGESQAYQQSLTLLRMCLTPAGFLASPNNVENYARIWSRDGVISGLAGLASGEKDLVQGLEHTLNTLTDYQGPHGEIPSNVSIDGKQISYGRLVGRVDSLLWYVIGVCAFLNYTKAWARKVRYWLAVERALSLAGCWEYNNRGLLYTPLSGNWADEYIVQGYVLSDLLLYEMALRSAGHTFKHKEWQQKAIDLREQLVVNFWPRAELREDPQVYHPYAYQKIIEQGEIVHWLPAFSSSGYTTYFDGLAHALALLLALGDQEQRLQVDSYVQSLEKQIGSALLPAFWPVIHPQDPQWAALEANHLFGELKNQPYRYHNGGLWPMVSGFYVLGLVRNGQQERAEQVLAAIHAANARGRDATEWEFAEFHAADTLEPLGTRQLAWSAAAGVLAHQAVQKQNILWPFSLS